MHSILLFLLIHISHICYANALFIDGRAQNNPNNIIIDNEDYPEEVSMEDESPLAEVNLEDESSSAEVNTDDESHRGEVFMEDESLPTEVNRDDESLPTEVNRDDESHLEEAILKDESPPAKVNTVDENHPVDVSTVDGSHPVEVNMESHLTKVSLKDLSTSTEVNTEDEISADYIISDICNASRPEEPSANINKRSAEYWLNTSTNTTGTTTEGFDTYNLSDEFISCLLSTVEPECYKRLGNGSVYVPLYNMVFNRGNYIINENILLVCPDFFEDQFESKFSSNIEVISIVGVFISTVCIVLHIIMFILVEKMRNLPGYCMLSMCLALLAAYICSFIQFKLSDHANCSAIGMIVYFSFLSSYFWMNVISFDVWQSIRLATTKFRLSSERPVLIRFSLYSLYAWGTPSLIVIVAVITDRLSSDVRFKLIFNEHTCWFKNKTSLLIYFALPLFIVLFVNILFFISSFHMITQSIMSKRSSGTHVGADLRSRLFLTLKLGTAMGLMWIFGVIAIVIQQEWVYYFYSACNALQGVFIFFSFTVNTKTLKAFKNASRYKKWSILPGPFPKINFFSTTVQTTTNSDNK